MKNDGREKTADFGIQARTDIEVEGASWQRYPVKTSVINESDDIVDIVNRFAKPHLKEGDMLFISERVVAITQGRAYLVKDIKPSRLAHFLVKFVHKSPYGIGLGAPSTMELAIREVGRLRILSAALVAAITKPLGIKGMFYRIAGNGINAIDGPCDYTLPPYNEYAVMGPKDPDGVANKVRQSTGNEVVIIDANDLGVNVLGVSDGITDRTLGEKIFKDNPLGQSSEQTPMCVVRKEVLQG